MTPPPMCVNPLPVLPSGLSLVTQCMQAFVQSLTGKVGQRTQRVGYSSGYPTNVVKACIHLPFLQSPPHLVIELFLLTLITLPLEPRGLKFSKVHLPSLLH